MKDARRTKPADTFDGHEKQFQVCAIEMVRYMASVKGVHADRIMHIPNGGKRHAIEAKNLKRQGVVPGYPDIMVFRPAYYADDNRTYHGLALELKVWPGKPTEQQEHVHNLLRIAGWMVVVCYGMTTVEDTAREYFTRPAQATG